MNSTWPHLLIDRLRIALRDNAELHEENHRLWKDRREIAQRYSQLCKQLEAQAGHEFRPIA